MKAKELIPILQLNPEVEIVVSTVKYRERSFQDFGYERGESQAVTNVNIDNVNGLIHLEGGK
ncbi:hypothetical protein QUO84_000520 [Enterococcus faecium]|nr:hypothetical protein [Enterococcus faecium]